MKKRYAFQYGKGETAFLLDENNILGTLEMKKTEPIADIEQALDEAFAHPVGCRPFDELFQAGDDVVIVISDITRIWHRPYQFVPYIVKRLNALNIPDSSITLLAAMGTHRRHTREEHIKLVTEELYERLGIVDHDCDGEVYAAGVTSRGTRVELNKLCQGKKLILTGGIVHHVMAGFGGGRKSIVPGIVSRKTIDQNHMLALDPDAPRSHPDIGLGKLRQNLLNEDMDEAARLVHPTFLVNSIVEPHGGIVHFAVGHYREAWEQGCAYCDELFGVPIRQQADIVIASCGGYPKDISLYQSVKSLFNAVRAVKKGGTLLLLAECPDGGGADEFFGWIRPLGEGNLDGALRQAFTIAGYIFYAMVEASASIRVILQTSIPQKILAPTGILACETAEEAALAAGLDSLGSKTVLLMPYAGNTVPQMQEDNT